MLRNELYTLERLGADDSATPAVRFRVRLDPSHPLFAGHFPGQPVLPGVCTLDMVREALSQLEERPCRFAAIRDCKFTAPVDPRRTQELELDLTAADGLLTATAAADGIAVLKLKASYIPLHG